MKKVTLKLTALVMLLGGTITVSFAQNQINVVTSAVPFLRITPDARSGGMGDVGIATAPDASASFANIARTPFANCNGGLSINYTPWLRDLSVNDVFMGSLAGYFKLGENQALSASFRYFKLGSIQFTDALGNNLNSYNPNEFAVDLGYSRKLSKKFGLGLAIRYINSNLAKGNFGGQNYKAGSSVAGDLHLFHTGVKENGQGLNWGLTFSNLGSKISYSSDATQKDYIPANLGFGLAYTKVFDESNKITFAADFNKLLVPTAELDSNGAPSAASLAAYRDHSVASSWIKSFGEGGGISEEIQEITAAIGAEYWYNNQFGFRTGYFYENANKGNRKFFTVGASLRYSLATLNFSYVFPTGSGVTRIPLSNTYRLGLVFNFGCGGRPEPVAKQEPAPTIIVVALPTVIAAPATVTPTPVDTDGDGVLDKDDRCPKTPGFATNKGCPDITIYYAKNVSELNAEDRAELDKVVTFLKNNPDVKVTLEGHASALGSDAANMKLTENRCAKSKAYLVENGIDAGRIATKAFGETQTVGDQNTEEGRAASRRLVVKANFQ